MAFVRNKADGGVTDKAISWIEVTRRAGWRGRVFRSLGVGGEGIEGGYGVEV